MGKENQGEIFDFEKTAYLSGVKAVVTFDAPTAQYSKPEREPENIDTPSGPIKYVPWGENNDTPNDLTKKVYASPILSEGMRFNIMLLYGDGILPVRREIDENGKVKFTPVFDDPKINEFFDNNDIPGYSLEQCTDISFFYNIFPEIILNQETPRKVVELNHLEAMFSRWAEMDPKTKRIEWHLYSAKFGIEEPKKEDIVVTKVLDAKSPLLDLKRRLGIEPYPDGTKKIDDKTFRYVIPVSMPTPGRFYYQKPYWVSIIESGWYEFAKQIPEFKKALLKNQMTIKYHVQLSENYWKILYAAEGITDQVKKNERRAKEFENIQKFLTDTKNTGKSVISYISYSPDGKEMATMKITAIENKFTGGEYIADLEEVSNIQSYAMGVHPSLIGSAPGKNKNINGTEARELFIIKQALLKPIRDRLLLPFYIIKAINKWDENIYFTIPNLELTTIDKGTGSQKVIS